MNDELRRDHLAQICRWVEAYVMDGHAAHVRTVRGDPEDLADLVKQLDGKAAVILTLDDWEAFREIMESLNAAVRA